MTKTYEATISFDITSEDNTERLEQELEAYIQHFAEHMNNTKIDNVTAYLEEEGYDELY